jgi:WD40 repeat protein
MKRKAHASLSSPPHALTARTLEGIARPAAVSVVRATLLPSATEKSRLTVVVGPAGSGKSRLVRDVVADPLVREAFPGGRIWVTVGPQPIDLPRQLARVGEALGDTRSEEYATRETAMERLIALLADRQALLVLDDVWDLHQALEWRDLRHPGHTLLVTRSQAVADAMPAEGLPCPRFSPEESHELLAWKTHRSDPPFATVAERLAFNPMALSIAGTLFARGMRPDDWLDLFDTHLAEQPADDDAGLRASFAINLSYLPDERRDLFYALGLFPPRVPIPESVIDRAWHALDASLSPYDRRMMFEELEAFALLERRPDPRAVAIHDVIAQIAREALGDRLVAWHSAFVDSYASRRRVWHQIKNDGYIYRFLSHHLAEARQVEVLRELLLDFDWLRAVLRHADMTAVQDGFALLHEDKTLRLVQEALWLSARTLSRDLSQLAPQLLARLQRFDIAAIVRFVKQIRRRIDRRALWLEPRKASLTTPGSALLDTFHGHLDVVRSVALTPDGRFAVTGSEDATVKVWEVATGRLVRTLYGHEAGVQGVAVPPDRAVVFSGSDDETVRLWDLETGEALAIMRHEGAKILSLTLTPDGQTLLTAADDGKIRRWDTRSAILLDTVDADRPIWSMAITPDGRRMIAASNERALSVWDLRARRIERYLPGHTDWVWDVAITPDGTHVVSASEDRTVIVWEIETGRAVRLLKGHQGAVRAVAVSADGAIVASASEDQSLKIWDFAAGTVVRTFTGHDDWVWDVALAPDGLTALSASDDHTVKRWSLSTQFRHPDRDTHEKSVRALRPSPDYIHAASVSDDQSMRLWRLSDGQLISVFEGHRDWVWDLAFSPSGRHIATASFDHTVRLWNVFSGREEYALDVHTDWIWAVRISPDGRLLVSGSEDGTAMVWRLEDGTRLHTLAGHTAGVTAIRITQDSRLVVTASADRTIRIWSLEDGRLLHVLAGHEGGIRSLHLSDITQRVVSASEDGTIRTWSLFEGTPGLVIDGHGHGIRHLLVLPLGFHALSAGEDRSIRLWDLDSGREEFRFAGHREEIRALALSMDGRHLASASDDHAAFLWDLETRKMVASFYADFPVTSGQFSNDGRTLILGDGGGGVHILEMIGD